MNNSEQSIAGILVKAGNDCQGEHRGLGVSVIAFKVLPQDEKGLLVLIDDNIQPYLAGDARLMLLFGASPRLSR